MEYLFNRDAITIPEVAMVHMGACCVARVNEMKWAGSLPAECAGRTYSFIDDAWELARCTDCGVTFFRNELREQGRKLVCEDCAPLEVAA